MMFYTYLYIDPRNNLPFYIGKHNGENNGRYGKRNEKETCIYCGRLIAKCVINRWHNENCKLKGKM